MKFNDSKQVYKHFQNSGHPGDRYFITAYPCQELQNSSAIKRLDIDSIQWQAREDLDQIYLIVNGHPVTQAGR